MLAGDLSENPYAFTGKRLDPESGLYHFHFRQYDAEVGGWTTVGPVGVFGGVNLYQYVKNNPVNRVDWLGLWDDIDGYMGEFEGQNYGNHPGDYNTEEAARERDDKDDGGSWWNPLWAGILDWEKLKRLNNPVKLGSRSLLQKVLNFSDDFFDNLIAPALGLPTPVKGVGGAIGLAIGETFNPREAGTPTLEDAGISGGEDCDVCDH